MCPVILGIILNFRALIFSRSSVDQSGDVNQIHTDLTRHCSMSLNFSTWRCNSVPHFHQPIWLLNMKVAPQGLPAWSACVCVCLVQCFKHTHTQRMPRASNLKTEMMTKESWNNTLHHHIHYIQQLEKKTNQYRLKHVKRSRRLSKNCWDPYHYM